MMRANLSPAEEAQHLARRKEIWEVMQNQVGQLVPPEIGFKNPPPAVKGFAQDTAEKTGQSKKDINRKISRAEALGDDIKRVQA